MIQLGGILSGFSLYALFFWMPIWQLGSVGSAEGVFRYFVVVAMLVFGVFMTSGGKSSFSFIRFVPAFIAGAMISEGWATTTLWLSGLGFVIFVAIWIFFGE